MILSNIKDNDKSFDYTYLLKRIFPFVKPFLGRALLGIAIAIPIGLLDSVVALSLKPYMDNVVVDKTSDLVLYIPFLIVGFAILQGGLKYFNHYLTSWSVGKMKINLSVILFKKMLSLDTEFYDKNTSGLIIRRFRQDVNATMTGLISNAKMLVSTIFSSLGLASVLFYNSWELALAALLALGLSFIPMLFIRNKIKEVSHKQINLSGNILTDLNETCAGNQTITSYNLKNHQTNKFSDQINENFNLSMSLNKRVGWLSPIMYLIASIGVATVMWYGNDLMLNGSITSGNFVSFMTALLLLYKPIKTLGALFTSFQKSFVSMARIFDLIDIEPNIKDKKNAIKLEKVKNDIKLDNISFEYEENQPVLNNITLEAKKGETIAIVGNSGGGKSTIAKLIPRFYDIKSGSIKIDDIDIRDYTLESLRDGISVVFQNNFLFSGTIKENILLGKFDATEEEIKKVIKDSYLEEFVNTLPKGIGSEIGERGENLSGGQRQRLAIARAMIKDAPILILDEATSALDNKSEKIVQMALEKLMQNRTVFVIAHRLSTIQNADKIAVIDQGNLAELGSHEELINKENGVYRSLYDAQFKKEAVSI